MDHGPDPEGSDDRWIAEQNDNDQLMDLTKQFSSDWVKFYYCIISWLIIVSLFIDLLYLYSVFTW